MTAESSTDRRPLYECTHDEAKRFFLHNDAYCNLRLPDYVDFSELLRVLDGDLAPVFEPRVQIGGRKSIKQWQLLPSEVRNNPQHYVIRKEKGNLSWRPISILHPVLYLGMVYLITDADNWRTIQDRMRKLKSEVNGIIECASDIPWTYGRTGNTGAAITSWWKYFDLKAMEESLEFTHGIKTDLANCYPSIYTHAIDWALTGKTEAKNNKSGIRIGSMIDKTLQDMSEGQTNGIPMGSVLMDFIAEILLLYLDACIARQIHKSIKPEESVKCKILRYRDDYTILASGKQEAESVLHIVNNVVKEFGFSLSDPKTKSSSDILDLCSKPDRLPAMQKLTTIKSSYFLLSAAKLIKLQHDEHPGGGKINKLLLHVERELRKYIWITRSTRRELQKRRRYFLPPHTILPTIAVFFDLALKNPNIAPLCFSIINLLLDANKEIDRQKVVDKIGLRVSKASHNEFFALWFLRLKSSNVQVFLPENSAKRPLIALHSDRASGETLWTNDWLKKQSAKKEFLEEGLVEKITNTMQDTSLFFHLEKYHIRPIRFSKKERTPFGDSDYE